MSLQTIFSPFHARPGLSYHMSLAIGAMLASLMVVAYAAGASEAGAVRAHIVLQGAEIILLTIASGAIASLIHYASTAGTAALGAIGATQKPLGA